jgi:hypothetical protein
MTRFRLGGHCREELNLPRCAEPSPGLTESLGCLVGYALRDYSPRRPHLAKRITAKALNPCTLRACGDEARNFLAHAPTASRVPSVGDPLTRDHP